MRRPIGVLRVVSLVAFSMTTFVFIAHLLELPGAYFTKAFALAWLAITFLRFGAHGHINWRNKE